MQIFLVLVASLSVPVLLLGKPLYLYWTYRGSKGLRRCRVRAVPRALSPSRSVLTLVSPQGYERVRRASEDDNATVQSYDDDEEEGLDEITRRDAAPKQVGGEARGGQ